MRQIPGGGPRKSGTRASGDKACFREKRKPTRETRATQQRLSERAVQRNHSVGRAAIFVEADVGAIKIEDAIWLIAGLRIDG